MQGYAASHTFLLSAAFALSALFGCLPAMAAKKIAPPSLVQAYDAAQASLRWIPGDDIQHSFHPVWTAVADLDGDGRSEVIYLYSATYTGGSFPQSNAVMVMTALKENDPRGQVNPKSLARTDAEIFAAIRQSGYADDAGEQIPGAVRSIRIEGSHIVVAFNVVAGARTCEVVGFKHICPPDGDYVWRLRWSPGALTRVD